MAKALYGHMTGGERVLAAEVARLRRRVAELEEYVARVELDRSLDLTPLADDLLAPAAP